MIWVLYFGCTFPRVVGQDLFLAVQPQHDSPKPLDTLHVLWPMSSPRPAGQAYAAWYKSRSLDWVSEGSFPEIAPDAQADVYYLSKPIFSKIGRATGIWHAGIGIRIAGGPSFTFEFTSIDFMAAVVYPDNKSHASGNDTGLLHWPSIALVDYLVDPSGDKFLVTGPDWSVIEFVGNTTGKGVNRLFSWAFDYGVSHPRYLVWRVLEPKTEEILIDSVTCFEFVFDGLRFLQNAGLATIKDLSVPRTIVNIYASNIYTFNYNATVMEFFSSERKVLEEWIKLSKELPVPFVGHADAWYWPAWFSTASHPNGTGVLLQNTDYPQIYNKYELVWPTTSKSRATALGVHRVEMPIWPST